jgi:hypothetical protein
MMAQPDPDDLADALSKLAGGEIAPSEQTPPSPPQVQPAAAKPPTPKPATRQPTTQRPVAARPARPTTPAPRPAGPTKSSPPPPRSPRSTPHETPLDVHLSSEAGLVLPSEEQPIVDDDDSVNVPAPDAAVFAPKVRLTPARRTGRAAMYQTIEFRRTIIPILLTCGTLMIVFGSLKYTMGQDSALAELPGWLPIVLFTTGAVLLSLAVVNMLSVKHQLVDVKK